jgi:hypothetical protein
VDLQVRLLVDRQPQLGEVEAVEVGWRGRGGRRLVGDEIGDRVAVGDERPDAPHDGEDQQCGERERESLAAPAAPGARARDSCEFDVG